MHITGMPGRRAAAALWRGAAIGATIAATAAVISACGVRAAQQAGVAGGTGAGNPAAVSSRPDGTGSGSAGPGTGSATPATSSPVAAAACRPARIRLRLDLGSAGVAAGSSYLPIDFTNVSALPCHLSGFPTVTLASRSGQQVGAAGRADRALAAENLLLGAGQTVHVWLHLIDVKDLPAARCQPVTAAGLRVALPGQASASFLGDALTTCHKQVHGTDILVIEPFRPGQARQGTAG
jgi:Protein of unknown function (DUF4232)